VIKNEVPTFDPSDPDNPAYQWTQPPPVGFSFRGSWQAHCTGDVRADGVHMVMAVSNQNYATHGRLAYYWSPDWGDTWFGHPDNPIIVPGDHRDGVPATGFPRKPTLLVDELFSRYILAYNAGHDVNESWRRRTHLAIAERPDDTTSIASPPDTQARFRLATIEPNPGSGTSRLSFELPVDGRLRVKVYSMDGRLVSELIDRVLTAGRHTIKWDKTARDGSHVPCSVYFVRGTLVKAGK